MSRFLLLALLLVAAPAGAQDTGDASSLSGVELAQADLAQAEADEVLPGDGPEGETAVESGEVALDEGQGAHGDADTHDEEHGGHGTSPPMWLVIPFVVLLLMIATGPLFYPHFWHHHYPKVAVGLGALTAAYYFLALRGPGEAVPIAIVHAAEEYFSFIALLGALFVASGTILIKTDFPGTPRNNAILLFVGSVLSNFIGTTGASMLLIRPFMRLNAGRLKAYHIVFFIFTVSNVGGALTPIGDPPLFLGFLRGVPFFWTVVHIWYIWLPTILAIIAVFWVIDARNKEESIREEAEDRGVDVEPGEVPGAPVVPEAPGVEDVSDHHAPDPAVAHPERPSGPARTGEFEVDGKMGFVWLAVVIASVFLDPNIFSWVPDLHELAHLPFGIREVIMLGVCVLAYKTAKPEALRGNDFNFEPIKEVGYLFIGIFLTMQPALTLIGEWAQTNADTIGVSTFYFGTGILSGVLDNAPTYVSFLSAAMGKFGLDVNVPTEVGMFSGGTEMGFYLLAISVASVFFGALTYIGNGPNFMVKAIAESSGAQTPSFVAYIVKYSLPVLIPIYVVVWLVFFSGWVLPTPVEAAEMTQAVIEQPALLLHLLP